MNQRGDEERMFRDCGVAWKGRKVARRIYRALLAESLCAQTINSERDAFDIAELTARIAKSVAVDTWTRNRKAT